MSQFRSKKLDIGSFTNTWILRDHTKRKTFAKYEVERCVNTSHCILPTSCALNYIGRYSFTDNYPYRQALRHIVRNTTLPQRARAQAQLQLTAMHSYTYSTQPKARCMLGGKGRAIFSDFRMSRVSGLLLHKSYSYFRLGHRSWLRRWPSCCSIYDSFLYSVSHIWITLRLRNLWADVVTRSTCFECTRWLVNCQA